MINTRLTVQDMKEMIALFVHHKLNSLRIGDLEIQKTYYEPTVDDNNKTFSQDDPLFYSAAQLPPEMEVLMESMKMNIPHKSKK